MNTFNVSKKQLAGYIAVVLISVAMVFFSSWQSPLLAYDEHCDIQMFLDVAREMANGSILYTDIYDHKGPWLYFMFLPAMAATPYSFLGAFVTECVVTAITSAIICRYCARIAKFDTLWPCVAALLANALIIGSSIVFIPSQAEFFALPWLVFALCAFYECVQHDRALTRAEALVIGLGCGWCFWAKFTICAFYVLLCICLVWHYIRHLKNTKLMWQHIGLVLAGMVAMTVPVAVYFAASGDVLLPVREYLGANILGASAYSQHTPVKTTVGNVCISLLPFALPCALMCLLSSSVKRTGKPSRISLNTGFLFLGMLVIFILLGIEWVYYLQPLLAFAPVMAYWLMESVECEGKLHKLLSRPVTVTAMALIAVVSLFSVYSTPSAPYVWETGWDKPASVKAAEYVAPNSSIQLIGVRDAGYMMSCKARPAASTLGNYNLISGERRLLEDTAQVIECASADYILAGERLKDVPSDKVAWNDGDNPRIEGYELHAVVGQAPNSPVAADGDVYIFKKG